MGKRATAPIPDSIRSDFFAAAWSIATNGRWVKNGQEVDLAAERGRSRVVTRRHGLAVLWATATAARFSELAGLTFDRLATGGGQVFVFRAKGGRSQWVPVCHDLVALTVDWRSSRMAMEDSKWLLPSISGNRLRNSSFNRDCCGLFGDLFGLRISSHSLRDTASQIAMSQQWRMQEVQRFLGHRSVRTTEIYVQKGEFSSRQLLIGSKA